MDRSRGVCGEAEVGHQILLAPFVAVIGAFAATAEVITDSCGKNTLAADTRKHCIRNGNSKFLACGKQKLEIRQQPSAHNFLRTPILIPITKHGCSGHVFNERKNMVAVDMFSKTPSGSYKTEKSLLHQDLLSSNNGSQI